MHRERVAHDTQRLPARFRPVPLVGLLAICLGVSACTTGDVHANSTQSTKAATASFDCGKAASATEKLICSDVQTAALDGKLQQSYKTALTLASEVSDKKTLTEEQRNWIRYNRDMCQDTACLQQTYIARIAMLARNKKIIFNESISDCKLPGRDDECVTVVLYRDSNSRISSFNQSIVEQKQGGKIVGCNRLIDLPGGHAHSNHSFGGVCVWQGRAKRTTVEICNDDMVGHFQMQPSIPHNVTDKQLIDFTYNHCVGS